MPVVSVSIPKTLYTQLELISKITNKSIPELIREACELLIQKYTNQFKQQS